MKRTLVILGVCLAITLVGCSKSPMETLKNTCAEQGYTAGMDYYKSIKSQISDEEKTEMLTCLKETLKEEIKEIDDMTVMAEMIKPLFAEQAGYDLDAMTASLDINNQLTIEEIDYDYDKDKLKMTVKNNSNKTITYFKYDIFIKDSKDDIIDSDWSNSSKTILPGAEAKVETYVDLPYGASSYSAKITEVKN